jgi:hypothetical protein
MTTNWLMLNDMLILSGRYARIGIMIPRVYCMVGSPMFREIAHGIRHGDLIELQLSSSETLESSTGMSDAPRCQ